jgi:undecaprenyl-diphosphatase
LDWTVVSALNHGLVGRDWLEDPVTLGSSAAVAVFAAATIGLWLLARPYREPTWKRACLSALLSCALALGVNQVIAHFVWERPRPFAEHPGAVHLFAGGSLDPSFPSDHAAAAFAIAVAVLFHSVRVGMAFLAVAVLIAVSRVAEGLHYPTDVLAGATVGAIAAVLVTRVGGPGVARLADTIGAFTDPIVERSGRALSRIRTTR